MIEEWLDAQADAMARLLMDLIAVDSENPPGRGRGRCADVLVTAMTGLDLNPEIIEVVGEPAIVRGTAGDGDKLLYFHGHFDVVPAQDRQQFTPERRDGRIVGRGSADMKGGIVSMLYGAAAAKQFGLLGDGRIVLHLVCDEETGSVVGAGHLRTADLIDRAALAMLTAEPSSGSVWHAARGALSLRVAVKGLEAHVGQADRGVSAFQHMLRVAQPVLAYAEEMAKRHTTSPMAPDDAAGTMVVVGGKFGGGSNFNVVPGSAYFTIDGRYNPEEDLDTEVARLKSLVDDPAVTVEVTQRQPAASTDVTHPAAAALAKLTGARFEMCPGVLETRWYSQLGIPAFGYGPGRLDVSHGPNEYVDEAAMRSCAAVYARYAEEMLR